MYRSIIAAMCLLLLAACTAFENPIVAQSGRTLDPALIGDWQASLPEGTLDLSIRRKGDGGIAKTRATKPDGTIEESEFEILTAKLERISYLSARERKEADTTWNFFAYEMPSADRLLLHIDDREFWRDAITNKIVSGTIEKERLSNTVTVTASEPELRAVVQGYGSVIFTDEVLADFTRQPEDPKKATTPTRP
jgi:hypothetical protein